MNKYRIFVWLTLLYASSDLAQHLLRQEWLLLPVPTLVLALTILTLVDSDA